MCPGLLKSAEYFFMCDPVRLCVFSDFRKTDFLKLGLFSSKFGTGALRKGEISSKISELKKIWLDLCVPMPTNFENWGVFMKKYAVCRILSLCTFAFSFVFGGEIVCGGTLSAAVPHVSSDSGSAADSDSENRSEPAACLNAGKMELLRADWFSGKNELAGIQPNLLGGMKKMVGGEGWICETPSKEEMNAVVWSVTLDQKTPRPFLISGESQFSGPKHGASGDYSLYVDAMYSDGTPEWGIRADFEGKEKLNGGEWESRSATFHPRKPIRRLTFYCLFRNREGAVSFRRPKLVQADLVRGKAISFDGLSVAGTAFLKNQPNAEMHSGQAASSQAQGPCAFSSPKTAPRFYVRDAGADSDWFIMKSAGDLNVSDENGVFQQEFEVSLGEDRAEFAVSWGGTLQGDGTILDAFRIRSLKKTDRCITLVAAFPISGAAARAFEGLDGEIEIQEPTEIFSSALATKAGMGRLNRFPLQGVANTAGKEFWLGIDPAWPAVYRTFFNAFTQELCIAFDLGFIPEKREWELRTCRFTQECGGMRSAWKRYSETYPDAFKVRVPKMGNWMAFAPVSQVKDPEDFGFAFKEGTDESAWDDENGLLTFRYTEPMTWWMSLDLPKNDSENGTEISPGTGDGTAEDLLEAGAVRVSELAEKGHAYARAWKSSVMFDQNQKPAGRWLDTPWCRGIVWSVSGLPRLPEDPDGAGMTDFQAKWPEKYVRDVYPKPENGTSVPMPGPGIDGEYIDSSEGYVTAELDFRRDHLPYTECPLTFSLEEKTPVIFRGLTAFEYVRAIERDVHAAGKLMMANSTPYRLSWLAPLLDVLGTESNWNPGTWRPMAVEELQYRRMLCGGKPFCFLQNTDFTQFSYEHSEKFMQRALAFGMFPSYFSADASTKHYFKNPELYERDRPLFKKYLPICRLLAEAGWEPVTNVKVSDPRLLVERFGSPTDGAYYLTVFNPTNERIEVEFTHFEPDFQGYQEILCGSRSLEPESVLVLRLALVN